MKKNRIIVIMIIMVIILSSFSLQPRAASGKYVALGDSIPAGYGLNNTAERYTNILAGKIGYTLSNYAVSGHKTSDLLARIKTSTVTNAIKQADLITISIGGNDFISDFSTILSALAGNDALFNECENNMTQITNYLKSNTKSSCIIIYQDIANCYKYTSYGSFVSSALKRVNSIIQKQCDNKKVFFCNVSTNLEKSSDNFFASQGGDYALDPHPTAKGHKSIANDMYSEYTYAKTVINKNTETTQVATTVVTTKKETTQTTQTTKKETTANIVTETVHTTQIETTYVIETTVQTISTLEQQTSEIETTTEDSVEITSYIQTEETDDISSVYSQTSEIVNVQTTSDYHDVTSVVFIDTIETKETKETTVPPRIDQTVYVPETEETKETKETTVPPRIDQTVYVPETEEIEKQTKEQTKEYESTEETTILPVSTTETKETTSQVQTQENTTTNNINKTNKAGVTIVIVLSIISGAIVVAIVIYILYKRKQVK